MVSATGICVLLLLTAQAAPERTPLSLQYWVVEGCREGHEETVFDANARVVRDALEDLPFDTWRTLHKQTARLQSGQDTRVPLKERYTLILRYTGRDDDGRARVAATVELASKDPENAPKTVLRTTLLLSREKARIGGLRTETGELVLVFSVQ